MKKIFKFGISLLFLGTLLCSLNLLWVCDIEARRTQGVFYAGQFKQFSGATPLELAELAKQGVDPNLNITYWPDYDSIQASSLSEKAKTLLSLPYYVHTLFAAEQLSGEYINAVGLIYSLAYLRQFSEGDRNALLLELESPSWQKAAEFLKNNFNRELEPDSGAARLRNMRNDWLGSSEKEVTQIEAIGKFLGREFSEDEIKEIAEVIRTRDRVINRSRAMRIGLEAIASQPGGLYDGQVLQTIAENRKLREVIFGIRDVAIVDTLPGAEKIREALWAMRQIEGTIVNILELPDGRFYIYDGYKLKRRAAEAGLDINIIATRTGLEHLIKKDLAQGKKDSVFYKVTEENISGPISAELVSKFASSILLAGGKTGQRFTSFDTVDKIYRAVGLAGQVIELEKLTPDAVYIATFQRDEALRKQLEAELENYRIFNHYAPIVIIDNSTDPFLTKNKENISVLREKYPEALIIHSATGKGTDLSDTEELLDGYAKSLKAAYERILNTEGTLDKYIMDILNREVNVEIKGETGKTIKDETGKVQTEKRMVLKYEDGQYKIDESALRTYLRENMFEHISGVRNHTFLIALARGDVIIMNMDDDAPPETYMAPVDMRNKVNGQKAEDRIKQMQDLIQAASAIDPRIKGEVTLYQYWDDLRFVDLEKKYFGFDPEDKNIGLIPRVMGEIQTLEKQYLKEASNLGLNPNQLTHMRYQTLMDVADNNVRISDFIYTPTRYERSDSPDKFMILPVNTFSQTALLGMRVNDTDLPVFEKDLRGTIGVPVINIQYIQQDMVVYVAYPFVGDQDTSALAQYLRYVNRDADEDFSGSELQHTHRFALLNEGVTGFAGDTYIIFNRGMFSISIPFPSIGRELRLEEPPYVKWIIAPVMEGSVTSAYATVGGGQIREIAQRIYNISTQDFTEMCGSVARQYYEQAVKDFYSKVDSDVTLQGEGYDKVMARLRVLGKCFISVADKLQLSDGDKSLLLEQRAKRAVIVKELETKIGEIQELINSGGTGEEEALWEKGIQALKQNRDKYIQDFFLSESDQTYLDKVLSKIKSSIQSDGETLILWPDVVDVANFLSAKNALLPQAQALLDFLDGEDGKSSDIGAPDFTQADAEQYNPLMLLVGSPSPQAFAEAAKRWKDYKDWWGIDVPIVASTGRGRGYKELVKNTLRFFEQEDAKNGTQHLTNFKQKYGEDIEKAKSLNIDQLQDEYYKGKAGTLTEAKVIAFILTEYGVPESAITLEEKSNNTEANMRESYGLIQDIKARFTDPNKELKIHVVADGFHRLRSLLQALVIFKKESWQINAEALYKPVLSEMDDAVLSEYVKHMIGDPDPNATVKVIDGVKIYGEIERLLKYTGFADVIPEFHQVIESLWMENGQGQSRIDFIRAELLKNYLDALNRKVIDYLQKNAGSIISKPVSGKYGMIDIRKIANGIGLSSESVAEYLRSPAIAGDPVNNITGVINPALGDAITQDTSIVRNLIVAKLGELLKSHFGVTDAATRYGAEIAAAAEKFVEEEKYREFEFINLIETGEDGLPLFNEDGTPKILKDVAQYDTFLHIEGNWHPTVHVMIVDKNGNVLMQERSNGQLDISASGHLAVGESLEEGALRELQEEVLGLQLGAGTKLVKVGSFMKIGGGTSSLKGATSERFENNIYYGPSGTVYNKEISTLYIYRVDEIKEVNGEIIVSVNGKEYKLRPNTNEKINALRIMPIGFLGQDLNPGDGQTQTYKYRGTPGQYFRPCAVWEKVREILTDTGIDINKLPEAWTGQI